MTYLGLWRITPTVWETLWTVLGLTGQVGACKGEWSSKEMTKIRNVPVFDGSSLKLGLLVSSGSIVKLVKALIINGPSFVWKDWQFKLREWKHFTMTSWRSCFAGKVTLDSCSLLTYEHYCFRSLIEAAMPCYGQNEILAALRFVTNNKQVRLHINVKLYNLNIYF